MNFLQKKWDRFKKTLKEQILDDYFTNFLFNLCKFLIKMNFKEITHYKGFNFVFWPRYSIIRRPTEAIYTVILNDSCKYKLNDSDQGDWNKLTGFTNSLGSAIKSHTVMIAWRYYKGSFQFGLYLHDYPNKHRILPEDIEVIYSTEEYLTTIKLLIDDVGQLHISFDDKEYEVPYQIKLNKYVRYVNSYFGGNNPAPQYIYYHLDCKFKTYPLTLLVIENFIEKRIKIQQEQMLETRKKLETYFGVDLSKY